MPINTAKVQRRPLRLDTFVQPLPPSPTPHRPTPARNPQFFRQALSPHDIPPVRWRALPRRSPLSCAASIGFILRLYSWPSSTLRPVDWAGSSEWEWDALIGRLFI